MKKMVFGIIVIAVITGGGIWWWKTVNDKKVSEKNNNETDYQAERSSVKQNNENIKKKLTLNKHIFNNIKVLGMSVELVKIIADISGYCV